MLFGPGINWWAYGGADPPPVGTHYSAMTGMSGIQGGDIDLISFLLTIGLSLCYHFPLV